MAPLAGTTVGFIGLGLMGRLMCRNLARAGARLVAHSRTPPDPERLGIDGLLLVDSPAAVAARAPIVILMVTDTPAVERVVNGVGGLIAALRAGHLIIDMGTTAVAATRRLAAQVAARGADYVDAPVSGGTVGAEAATLSIMAGGEPAAIERARPILAALGQRLTHVGAVGAGQVAKAANQVIVGLVIGAVAEALTLARRAGVDPAKVREALLGGFADSRILDLHGRRMVEGDFRPGGRATTQRKDMAQALELADSLGVALPATRLNCELYDRLIALGFGDLDHSALIKVLETD